LFDSGKIAARLVLVLAVIENFADRRGGVGGNLDEIEAGLLGLVQCGLNVDGPKVVAGLIDQLDFWNTDLLVDARAVLLNGWRGSYRATNGSALLKLLQRARCCGPMKNQFKPPTSQRPFGSNSR